MICPKCKATLGDGYQICPYCEAILNISQKNNNSEHKPINISKAAKNDIKLSFIMFIILALFAISLFISFFGISSLNKINSDIISSDIEISSIFTEKKEKEEKSTVILNMSDDDNVTMSPIINISLIKENDILVTMELITLLQTTSADAILINMQKTTSDNVNVTLNSSYINEIKSNDSSWVIDKNNTLKTFFYRDDIKINDIKTIDLIFDIEYSNTSADISSHQVKVRVYQDGAFGLFKI